LAVFYQSYQNFIANITSSIGQNINTMSMNAISTTNIKTPLQANGKTMIGTPTVHATKGTTTTSKVSTSSRPGTPEAQNEQRKLTTATTGYVAGMKVISSSVTPSN